MTWLYTTAACQKLLLFILTGAGQHDIQTSIYLGSADESNDQSGQENKCERWLLILLFCKGWHGGAVCDFAALHLQGPWFDPEIKFASTCEWMRVCMVPSGLASRLNSCHSPSVPGTGSRPAETPTYLNINEYFCQVNLKMLDCLACCF